MMLYLRENETIAASDTSCVRLQHANDNIRGLRHPKIRQMCICTKAASQCFIRLACRDSSRKVWAQLHLCGQALDAYSTVIDTVHGTVEGMSTVMAL